MRIRTKEPLDGVSIEMMPLIDMVFLLLIFFLVATTFRQEEREMQIALPVAKASGPISAALREMIVNVNVAGEIIVGGRQTSHDDFAALIQRAVEANPEQKVTVRGDRATVFSNVMRVLDICKGSGIQEGYLGTVLE